jgi:hypothetical protein
MIKRGFLILLLLILAVLLIPSLRQRAQPRIDTSREWLGQKLEGPLSPVLTPYRTIKTQERMGEAVRFLIRDRNRGVDAPRPNAFDDYLQRHEILAVDGWGVPFVLDQDPDSLSIISVGPDLQFSTEDDIVTKIRYAAPDRWIGRRR